MSTQPKRTMCRCFRKPPVGNYDIGTLYPITWCIDGKGATDNVGRAFYFEEHEWCYYFCEID